VASRGIGCLLVLAAAAIALTNGSGRSLLSQPYSSKALRHGSQMAEAVARRGVGGACEQDSRCDRLTSCIAPALPAGPILKIPPEHSEHARYVRDLQAFQACREAVLASMKPRGSNDRPIGLAHSGSKEMLFADIVQRWNGDIFWAPASASSNVITRFGDEARAVFGPIPDGDCAAASARTLPLEVDGNIVDLKPNPGKAGYPLEFEHRDPAGNVVKWTDGIPRCDKPSLAGNVTYCGLNSRLNRVVKGNVEWLFFCRKSTTSLEVGSDPYWQRSNPRFAVFGTIGFNSLTGEIVFFDGRKDRYEFDWSMLFVPPGGHSYSDGAGRAEAEALYDPTFQVQCYACHDNKNAYVIDPHAGQARVGYFGGKFDPRAIALSLGDYLPERPREERAPFRVVGSAYTATYSVELERAKTVRDPAGNCTGCHTLTTQVTGRRFAPDAVAQEPWISHPTWAQLLELHDEKTKYASVARHRTDWALRSGLGKIHPWMVPGDGNELSALPPGVSPTDWQMLSNCLWGAGGPECGYRPLYTRCPAPDTGREGDGSELVDAATTLLPLPADETAADWMLRVSWRYLNRYGGVPQRDDVRFNVAVKEIEIPLDGRPPTTSDYPSLDEAKGKSFTAISGEIGMSGSAQLIQNASYLGHTRWTEPTATTGLRDFRIDLPGTCNRRYLIRILPKRFCFDQSNIEYSSRDNVLFADVRCN
jgi:hypothetical protein